MWIKNLTWVGVHFIIKKNGLWKECVDMNKEKIKTIISKIINIKTTYLVLLVVVSLVLVVLYFSYALFTVSVEKKGCFECSSSKFICSRNVR